MRKWILLVICIAQLLAVVGCGDSSRVHEEKNGEPNGPEPGIPLEDLPSWTIKDVSIVTDEIKKWNKLKSNNIPLGKSLKIITNERVVTTVKKEVKSDAIASNDRPKKEQKSDVADKEDSFYVVQQGDNLSTIAKKYNVSIDDLKSEQN